MMVFEMNTIQSERAKYASSDGQVSLKGTEMIEETTRLESPVEVMYLIHKALRAEAARVEKMVGQLETGESLQPFRAAFNLWASALGYHAEKEDKHMTVPLTDPPQARENEEAHRALERRIEDVLACLNGEIGKTRLIARTQRHLFGAVVALRIAQDDHLEEEEAFVLPLVREHLSEEQQMEVVRQLLVDEDAQDQRWILDWVAKELAPTERGLLAKLEARFEEVSSRPASVET